MADYPKRSRVSEEKRFPAGDKCQVRQRKLAEGLERQNAIYREVFAKANVKFPEMNKLGNYCIPKKSSNSTGGKFVWEDGQGTKVKWVEEPAAEEKYVQKSILELPYKDVEEYEQQRLKGGYNRRPGPPPPRSPEPATSTCWAPWRKDQEPKTLNTSTTGSSHNESSLATVRVPARPRHRFQSDRNGDFDRGDYASLVGTMKSTASCYVVENRSPVTEICPFLASGQASSGVAAGSRPEGDRNSERMDTGENCEG